MSDNTKRIVLCLDGTWNNPYQKSQREDGTDVLKPSNPLKMARAVLPWDAENKIQQITYYDSGVGALGNYPGTSNRIAGFVDSKLGGIYGAGFEANIEQAVTFLINNYSVGDAIYVFGFSRGAAQARGFTRFLSWMGGLPTKADAYYVPVFFREYLKRRGSPADTNPANSDLAAFEGELQPCEIELLAVWDTVMALGSRFKTGEGTSVDERSFHVGVAPAPCVKHARQALALDEQRYDFRPEVWHSCEQDQSLEQRWFAGVHSNIGGGYVHDGLANLAFRWLWKEAEQLGLAVDKDFVGHYGGFAQDHLYDSRSWLYSAIEAIRFKRGDGVRDLTIYPETANLHLDKSVIWRLRADPVEDGFDRMSIYRPQNVIDLLKSKRDGLEQYLKDRGVSENDPMLPPDVTAAMDG